jgi:hypothetical protein
VVVDTLEYVSPRRDVIVVGAINRSEIDDEEPRPRINVQITSGIDPGETGDGIIHGRITVLDEVNRNGKWYYEEYVSGNGDFTQYGISDATKGCNQIYRLGGNFGNLFLIEPITNLSLPVLERSPPGKSMSFLTTSGYLNVGDIVHNSGLNDWWSWAFDPAEFTKVNSIAEVPGHLSLGLVVQKHKIKPQQYIVDGEEVLCDYIALVVFWGVVPMSDRTRAIPSRWLNGGDALDSEGGKHSYLYGNTYFNYEVDGGSNTDGWWDNPVNNKTFRDFFPSMIASGYVYWNEEDGWTMTMPTKKSLRVLRSTHGNDIVDFQFVNEDKQGPVGRNLFYAGPIQTQPDPSVPTFRHIWQEDLPAITWDFITLKPTTFPPSAHNHDGAYSPLGHQHVLADITDYVPGGGGTNFTVAAPLVLTPGEEEEEEDPSELSIDGLVVNEFGELVWTKTILLDGEVFTLDTNIVAVNSSVNIATDMSFRFLLATTTLDELGTILPTQDYIYVQGDDNHVNVDSTTGAMVIRSSTTGAQSVYFAKDGLLYGKSGTANVAGVGGFAGFIKTITNNTAAPTGSGFKGLMHMIY